MTTEKRKCGCSKGPVAQSSIIQDSSPTAKICITTDKAPLPVGPYSQAVKMDKTIYVSGCLGLQLDTGLLVEGGAVAEARLALKHLGAILDASGSSYNNVLKTTVFLANMDDFADINEVYRLFFYKDYPARSCVQVARLPLDAKFEIEAIATIIETGEQPPPPPGGGESIKEPSAKDASVKEASVKEASVKEASVKEASVKEASVKEASVKEPSKEGSVKSPSVKDPSVKEPSMKEASVKSPSVKEPSVAPEEPADQPAEAPAEEDAPPEDAAAAEDAPPAEEPPAEEPPAEEKKEE